MDGDAHDEHAREGTLKRASVALLIVFATCLVPRLRHPALATHPVDFNVYYAASMLVHQGRAAEMYTGADTGADPQKAIAAAGTPIDRAAHAEGLSFVGLYVYPPLLADLLVPFTLVDLQTAQHLWLVANGVFLLLIAALLLQLLDVPLLSAKAALIALPLVCFTPVLQCLVDGQVTIFLLLLWIAGMVLYRNDRLFACGMVFALATAIKLTPALILIPFLIWRTWRLMSAYLITLFCLAMLCLWVDTPHAFGTYFLRVMPAMSGSIPFFTNFSLAASTERLLTIVRTGTVAPYPESLAASTIQAGRAVSVGTLLALVILIARAGRSLGKQDRILVLGLISLMAPILSPVSWFHAYAMAFVAFVLLWQEALRSPVGKVYLSVLTVVSLLLGSAVSENLLPYLVYAGQETFAACCLQWGQLCAASALVLYRIGRMRGEVGREPRHPQAAMADPEPRSA